MTEHDRTLASRAKNLLDTLHEFRQTDIQALHDQNDRLSRRNEELSADLSSLRQQVQNMANLQLRERANTSIKLITKAFHIFSACKLTPAWTRWRTYTSFKRDLTESNTKKATLFQRIINEMVLRRLRKGFSLWSCVAKEIRAKQQKKSKAMCHCLEVADKYITQRKRRALYRWKEVSDWIYHRGHRHRFHEMVRATEDTNEKFTVIVREVFFMKEDNERNQRTASRLYGESCSRIDEVSRKNMMLLNAESKRLDSSLSRLSLESIPKLNARMFTIEEESASKTKRLDGMIETVGEIDTRLVEVEANLSSLDVRVDSTEESAAVMENQLAAIRKAHDSSSSHALGTQTLLNEVTQTVSCLQTDLNETNTILKQHMESTGTEIKQLGKAQIRCAEGLEANRGEVEEQAGILGELTYEMRMKIAKKPEFQSVVKLCADYEDLACEQNFSPDFPDHLPTEVSIFATAIAHYVAETANAEALERVFAGSNPDELVYAEVQLESRRDALRAEVRNEMTEEVSLLRPGTGTARLSARQKFIGRMMEAVDVALTRFEAVVTLANTRFGKVKAIPSCVACDRPLPTRLRRDPKERSTDHKVPESTTANERTQAVLGTTGLVYENDLSESLQPPLKTLASKTKKKGQDETPFLSKETVMEEEHGKKEEFVKRGGFKMPSRGVGGDDLRHSIDALPRTSVRKEFMLSGTQSGKEHLAGDPVDSLPRGRIRPRPRSAIGVRDVM